MFTIHPRGPFDISQTASFRYIDRDAGEPGRAVRLGFCRDGSWQPAGALVYQDAAGGPVRVEGDPGDRSQIERVLGLDVDASGFADVGERDEVIGRLQRAAPGLRPPQIYSAYEAAVFCILAARRSAAAARGMRRALAQAAGTVLDVAGQPVVCLPPPAYLADPAPVRGMDTVRRERLMGVARAAEAGELDTATLVTMEPEQARKHLERIPGIGPFSSAIVVVRSLGHTDYLAGPITELNALVGQLYDLGHSAEPAELDSIAAAWSPWRTWTQLYIRSVSPTLARS